MYLEKNLELTGRANGWVFLSAVMVYDLNSEAEPVTREGQSG